VKNRPPGGQELRICLGHPVQPIYLLFLTTDKARAREKVSKGGIGAMTDEKLTLEDLKASHTLGGAGEGDAQGEGSG